MLNRNELKSLIYTKYRTLSQCAEDLGVDESTLSRNLNKPTVSLLQRLRSLYIDIPPQPEEKQVFQEQYDLPEVNYMKEITTNQAEQIEFLKGELKKKDEMIMYFREELKKKELTIISMNNIIENYVKVKDGKPV